CLAGPCRRDVLAIQQNRFDFRDVAESRQAISCEMRILNAAVFEFDGLEERPSQPLNHRANDLVAQTIRIDNRAAFERLDQAYHTHRSRSLVHHYFGERCDVTALLVTARDSESLP